MTRHSGAGVSSFTTDRIQGSVLRLTAVLLGLFGATASRAADEVATVYFGTDVVPNEWLITGAGGTNVPAVLVTPYPQFISFSSTGTATGQFIPGASWVAFDGAWTADLSFELPRRAQDVYLDFFDLYADDRVVLLFNGVAIGDGTMNGDVGVGQHTFEPGDQAQSFTFSQTTEGRIDDRKAFILGDRDPRGKENVLRLSVNNTGTGTRTSAAQALPPGSNNGTVARVRGLVRWTEDYQIRPYPNPADNLVDVDDDPHGWYNAVNFVNDGAINVVSGGSLENRGGAQLQNFGQIGNDGQMILNGLYYGLPGARFVNNGAITLAGSMVETGTFVNNGTLGLLQGADYTFSGTGLANRFSNINLIYNQGTFTIEGPDTDYAGNLNAGIGLNNPGTLTIRNGAEASENILNNGSIVIVGDAFLSGSIGNNEFADVNVLADGAFAGELRNEGTVTVDTGGRVTTLSGYNQGINSLISVGSGGTLAINLGTFVNEGQRNVENLRVSAGGTLLVERKSATLDNVAGMIMISGSATTLGTVHNGNVIDIEQGGQFLARGAVQNQDIISVHDAGSLLEIRGSSGTLDNQAGGRVRVSNDGIMLINGGARNDGAMTVGSGGRLAVTSRWIVSGQGTIGVTNGGWLVVDGEVRNVIECGAGGILSGHGIMTTVTSQGCSWRPGNSPGTLTIAGDVSMDGDSSIEVEIGSPDDYDRLAVGGAASFAQGAQVNVSFVDGYLPDERDDFAWLSGQHITGAGGLIYQVPYEGWSYGGFTDGAGTTHISMSSANAVDLGGGLNPGVVIGSGQVAFVETTGLYTDYQNGGVFDNSGVVHNREGSLFFNPGTFSSAPGSLVNRAGAWFVNRGQFINDVGAPLENAGTFYNHATGVLDNQSTITNGPGARFVNRGQVSNSDTIVNAGRFENRGEIANHGDFGNRGEVAIAAGASLHGGNYTQTAGRTQVDANGVLAAYMIFTGGTLGGNGRLEGELYLGQGYGNEGFTTATLDPGDPLAAGRVELAGNFTLDGILHIDIAGAALHDVLAVDGTLTSRDSTLEVALLDEYDPQLGDRFDFLTARSSGAAAGFAHLLLPGLDPGLAWVTRYVDDGILATYGLEVVASEVPAPASVGLLASALGIAAARMRRRARGCRVASSTGAATRPADALPL